MKGMLSGQRLRAALSAPLLFVVLVGPIGCRSEDAPEMPLPRSPAPDRAATLVVGDVEANLPIRRIRWIQPLADHLAGRLADHGIRRGRVVVAHDLRQMASYLEDGTVDVYLDSPLPTLAVQKLSGSRIVLRRLVNGQRDYWSVFVTRSSLGIQGVDDFRGQVLAFQEQHSTTGFLLPAHTLLEQGYQLREVGGARESVAADEVGYFFSGDEENTIDMLRTGRVALGAISNQDLAELPEELRQQLRVVARTERIPRQLVSLRPGLDPELARGIRQQLLGLTDSDREELATQVQGSGWTWVFEALSDESRQHLERFSGTVDLLLRIED